MVIKVKPLRGLFTQLSQANNLPAAGSAPIKKDGGLLFSFSPEVKKKKLANIKTYSRIRGQKH